MRHACKMRTTYAVGLATLILLSKKEKVSAASIASTGLVSLRSVFDRMNYVNTPAGFYASQLKKPWRYENEVLKVG